MIWWFLNARVTQFSAPFLPFFLIPTSFNWAYKTDSIYWIHTEITNSPVEAHSLSSTVVLILPCHTTHGNRCCSTGENWDTLRCYGWTGGRARADANACLWKTRWTDNTGPSVFSTTAQELALPEPETWFRRHRWRGKPYSQNNIPLSLLSKSLPGNPNTEERWETGAFKDELDFTSMASAPFSFCCLCTPGAALTSTPAHTKTNCWPDVREAKDKQRHSFLLCHTPGPPKLAVIDIRNS